MSVLQFALAGLPSTALLILLSQSIVVVHRGSGVPNFAAGAMGMWGAYVFFKIWRDGMPWPIAMVVALAAAGAIGAATHLIVMRRLRAAPLSTKIIATLGLMTVLIAVGNLTFGKNGAVLAEPSLLPSSQLKPFHNLSFSSQGLWLLLIALGVTGLLMFVQRRTRFGLATTAVCESPGVTATMGHSPDQIAALNWALGAAIASVATILLVPLIGLGTTTLALTVVPALGAALLGQFDSFLLTLLGALAIGVGEAETALITKAPGWTDAAPIIIIVAVLLLRGTARHTRSEVAQQLPSVGKGLVGLPALGAVIAGAVLVVFVGTSWISAVQTSFLIGLVLLSVVVLTGYAGQLSLAQYALAGVGAFMTALFAGWGVPVWLSIILAVVCTVPAGAVFALPSLRTRGASFAIVTLSLLVVVEDLVLTNPDVAGKLTTGFGPLRFLGMNFNPVSHPRFYAGLSLVAFVLVALVVTNIRRSPSGRRMLAVRANPQAAAAVGVSVTATKLFAFAIATAIAALAGALLEAQLAYPDFSLFDALSSINVVLQATVGGVGWIAGGILGGYSAPGAAGARVLQVFFSPSAWLDLISGAGVLLVLMQAPGGIAELQASQYGWIRRHVFHRSPSEEREDVFARAIGAGRTRPPSTRRALLEARGLTVTFGSQRAVDDVTLSIGPGEIVGLIGPNGAGKSTFIDAVCGNVNLESGSVSLDGTAIDGRSPTQRALLGLGRTFQSLELFEDMTVGENLLVASERPTATRIASDLIWPGAPLSTATAKLAAENFRLIPSLGAVPKTLDYGRRRLVAVARAFAGDPSVIFLDEPAAGLDRNERAELGELLQRVCRESNIGILLVEHDVNLVFSVCDRVCVLEGGRVIATGSPEEVRHDPKVIEAYLGMSSANQPVPIDLDAPAEVVGGGSSDGG